MVAILFNFSTIMCHAFISNKIQMSTFVNLNLDFLEAENVEVDTIIEVILNST